VASPNPYCGNPELPGKPNGNEPYVFINFYDTNGTFDKILFHEGAGANNAQYESDHHTVGFYLTEGGVPEPASWTMMLLGAGGIGFALRRRAKPSAALTA
jgi:hypothetical protein